MPAKCDGARRSTGQDVARTRRNRPRIQCGL